MAAGFWGMAEFGMARGNRGGICIPARGIIFEEDRGDNRHVTSKNNKCSASADMRGTTCTHAHSENSGLMRDYRHKSTYIGRCSEMRVIIYNKKCTLSCDFLLVQVRNSKSWANGQHAYSWLIMPDERCVMRVSMSHDLIDKWTVEAKIKSKKVR